MNSSKCFCRAHVLISFLWCSCRNIPESSHEIGTETAVNYWNFCFLRLDSLQGHWIECISIWLGVDEIRKLISGSHSQTPLWSPHRLPVLRTCFQGHTVAGRAPSCWCFCHSCHGKQWAAGQAAQGAGPSCTAAPIQPFLPLGGHSVNSTIICRLPVHVNHREYVLWDIFNFRAARS